MPAGQAGQQPAAVEPDGDGVRVGAPPDLPYVEATRRGQARGQDQERSGNGGHPNRLGDHGQQVERLAGRQGIQQFLDPVDVRSQLPVPVRAVVDLAVRPARGERHFARLAGIRVHHERDRAGTGMPALRSMERSGAASTGAGSLAVALATTTMFLGVSGGGWHPESRTDPKRKAVMAAAHDQPTAARRASFGAFSQIKGYGGHGDLCP